MYENARKVFQAFCSFYEEKAGSLSWFCQFEDVEKATGLEQRAISTALEILQRKDLIQRAAEDAWQMTETGADAFDTPVILDELLPVRR